MKHNMIIRVLSLVLAGNLLFGSPLQVFATELDAGTFEAAETVSAVVQDEKEGDEPQVNADSLTEFDTQISGEKQEELVSESKGTVEEKMPEEVISTVTPSVEDDNEQQEISDDEEEKNASVENIAFVSLEPSSLTLVLGGEPGELKATAFDEYGNELAVNFSWNNNDGQIVTVDGNEDATASVTAKTVGTAIIEVKAGDKTAICEVTVIIPIQSVELDKTSLSLKKNQIVNLKANIIPENTTEDKTLIWSSSNEKVATVDSTGTVTAIGSGEADIIVKTADGHQVACKVVVSNEEWRTGWQHINNKWYYYDQNSEMQTGWQEVNGKYYYFDVNGVMQTGWLKLNGKWYYLNANGDRRSGWLELNSKWYYLDPDGVMQIGLKKAGKYTFYFNSNGEMQTGWQKVSGKWYYIDYSTGVQTGWKYINNKWYYLDSSGVMQTGWQKISNKWYYLNSSGAMQTGWQKISNKWYYLNSSGAMQTGWQKISNKWYYLNSSGAMQTGWQKISNKWYYLNSSGAMQTGWQKISNKWYYLNSSGVMQTGWQKINSKWYYLNASGAMQTGWQKISNKWYYLNSSGVMQTGWINVNGKRYYLNSNGEMQTGWQPIGGSWYYLNSDGSMRTGWLQSGNAWYYFKSNGVMATSDTTIDGKTNSFDSNGVWKGVVATKIRAYGIDVSSNQGSIDWKDVANDGIDFAMLRVVTGKGSNMERDTRFKEYYDGARDEGIKVGVYRYSYATSRTKAKEEADAVIKALNGRKLDYPVVLDMEDSSILSGTDSNARRSEIILAFKKKIEDAGYDFALYANITWLNKYLDMDMLEDVDIWVARWRNLDQGHGYTGQGNVTMWQYSSSGKVDGISGKVDLNVCYKKY